MDPGDLLQRYGTCSDPVGVRPPRYEDDARRRALSMSAAHARCDCPGDPMHPGPTKRHASAGYTDDAEEDENRIERHPVPEKRRLAGVGCEEDAYGEDERYDEEFGPPRSPEHYSERADEEPPIRSGIVAKDPGPVQNLGDLA